MGWKIGVIGFDSQQELGIFFSSPPHPYRVPSVLSAGLKRPERESNQSPPSSAEVNNAWSYISTPPIRLHGVVC